MNNDLTEEVIQKLKEKVKQHIEKFSLEKFSKEDSKSAAKLYAARIYEKLQDLFPEFEIRDKEEKANIVHVKINEMVIDKSGEELFDDVLEKSTSKRFEWHTACRLASLFIRDGVTMPPNLSNFVIDILEGKAKEPSDHSGVLARNDAIISCIYWLTTDNLHNFREEIGYPDTKIIANPNESSSDTAHQQSACGIVTDVMNELGFDMKFNYIVDIWKKRDKAQ